MFRLVLPGLFYFTHHGNALNLLRSARSRLFYPPSLSNGVAHSKSVACSVGATDLRPDILPHPAPVPIKRPIRFPLLLPNINFAIHSKERTPSSRPTSRSRSTKCGSAPVSRLPRKRLIQAPRNRACSPLILSSQCSKEKSETGTSPKDRNLLNLTSAS